MDKIKDNDARQWVERQLEMLAPARGWEPSHDRGLEYLQAHERAARRRRRLQQGTLLAVLVASLILLMVPTTRGVAERLLNRFSTKDLGAVRLNVPKADLKGLLPRIEFTTPPRMARYVPNIAEAQNRAGFAPRLPKEFLEKIAAGSIVLGVRGPTNARLTIHAAALRAALRKRGIENVQIPDEWDRVEINQQVSPSIMASFKDGTLVQAQLPVVLAPAGFVVEKFLEIELLIAGLSAAEAQRLSSKFAASGDMFAMVPSDTKTNFREVALASGHGLLFENDTDLSEKDKCAFCPGPHELALTWTTPDLVFQLRSDTLTPEEAIELANSVDRP